MFRLIFADFRANLRIWAGALVVAAGAAAVGLVVAAQVQTAIAVGGLEGAAIASIASTVLLLGAVAGLVVLSSVTNLTVALQRRDYALWQLVGIRPAYLRLVVLAQLGIVALLGGAAGTAAMFPALPKLFTYLYAHSDGLTGVHARYGPASAGGALLFVVVVILLGGLRGARTAARTPPIALLREAGLPERGMTVSRWVAGIGTAVLVLPMAISIAGGGDPGSALVSLVLLAGLAAGVLAAFGPLYLSRFVRAWTALVPARASSAWYLARHSTADNIGRSTAAITPLMVAVALSGGIYAVSETLGGTVPFAFVLLLMGGPLLLSVLGATVTVLMAGRRREREFALIRAAGGTPVTVLAAAAWEAVIYTGTAALLGFAAVLVPVGVTVLAAHGAGIPVTPSLGLAQGGTVALAGLILTGLATLVPSAAATRRPVSRELAAE